MEVEEVAAVVHLYCKYIKKKKRYWVHPLRAERPLRGYFAIWYSRLRAHEEEFFSYTRMSVKSFDELLAKIATRIRGTDTSMRLCIGNEEKLLVTLGYLAEGSSFSFLRHYYQLGATTIREVVRQVCKAIWDVLRAECLPEPTREGWLKIAQEFESRANFPNCLGAIDGKHIRLVKPPNSASIFYNYKKFFSIVLMAVTDANYKFLYIDVGAYGKCSDSTVFEDTVWYRKVQSGSMNLPQEKAISNLNPMSVPFVFLADDAFALSRSVMCPYVGKHLTEEKRIYNYRHCRGRRFVECTFGILASKWRIFHRALNVDVDFSIDIVKACCILHNFIRDRDGVQFQDTLNGFPTFHEDGRPTVTRRPTRESYARRVRNEFTRYFANEGSVPWQHKYL